jgi:glyoxylase-like metal-dependent hydrolase (beta-lactamase superfamily II)
VAAHRLEARTIARAEYAPLSPPTEIKIRPVPVAQELADGDLIKVGSRTLTVLHTPGHSPGSLCLYAPEAATLFSGDTLFAGTFGRYDLPGGDGEALRASLRRLAALPRRTAVLPGHGRATTIGDEAWLTTRT